MYKKTCDQCHQPSFSSCEKGTWFCPICDHDITHVMHQNAESQAVVKQKFEALQNRFTMKPEQPETINKYV